MGLGPHVGPPAQLGPGPDGDHHHGRHGHGHHRMVDRHHKTRENPDPGRKLLCVVRGGAFNLGDSALRCAFRVGAAAGRGRQNIGFRVVCTSSE